MKGVRLQLSCVGPEFSHKFHFSSQNIEYFLAWFLRYESFTCIFNATKTSHICTICPQGTYSDGLNECIPCPRGGFYQDQIGMTSISPPQMRCKYCSNGTYVKESGGTSQEDCMVCPDGTNTSIHAGFRACFCKDGFARRDRFGQCYPCKLREQKCSGQDFQSLEAGYFWDWDFPNANITEYNEFVANLMDETMIYDNHTFYSKEIPRVHKCPRPESCQSNIKEERSVKGVCFVGYKGWLCAKCQRGFYAIFTMCLRCPDDEIIFLEVLFVLCVCSVTCYVICRRHKIQTRERNERNIADAFVSRMKIVLGFYQVVGIYLPSFHNVSVEGAMHIVAKIFFALEINVLKFLILPKCFNERLELNPKVEFIVAMVTPLICTVLPLFAYFLLKLYTKIKYRTQNINKQLTNLRAKTLTIMMGLLFVTYPPVCTSVFQLLPAACHTFCLDVKNKYCFTVLRSDYEVRCDNQLIVFQVLAVIATFGYVLAFPLVLFLLLCKYCSKTLSQTRKGRKPSSKQTRENPETRPFLFTDSKQRDLPLYSKFLCENYKLDFWYWEIVELGRKVTQTVSITLLGWENKFAALLTIGMSVLFLTLHSRYRPMKSVREQYLQMFSLAAILTNVVFIAVRIPEKYKDSIALFLIFLNLSVIVIIFLESLFAIICKSKRGFSLSKRAKSSSTAEHSMFSTSKSE